MIQKNPKAKTQCQEFYYAVGGYRLAKIYVNMGERKLQTV